MNKTKVANVGKAVKDDDIPPATLHGLKKFAKFFGATVECDSAGRYETYQVCAPIGKTWAVGPHMLRVSWHKGDSVYKLDSLVDAIERMTYGLEDCTEQECDYCCEVADDCH